MKRVRTEEEEDKKEEDKEEEEEEEEEEEDEEEKEEEREWKNTEGRRRFKNAIEEIEEIIAFIDYEEDLDDFNNKIESELEDLQGKVLDRKIELERKKFGTRNESIEKMLDRIADGIHWAETQEFTKCGNGYCIVDYSNGEIDGYYRPKGVNHKLCEDEGLVLCNLCLGREDYFREYLRDLADQPYFKNSLLRDQIKRAKDASEWERKLGEKKKCCYCMVRPVEHFLKREAPAFKHNTYSNWMLCGDCFRDKLLQHVSNVLNAQKKKNPLFFIEK